jgi:hypothetical protein
MDYNEAPPSDKVFKDFLDSMLDEYLNLLIAHVTLDALIDKMFQAIPTPSLCDRLENVFQESNYVSSEMETIRYWFKNHNF